MTRARPPNKWLLALIALAPAFPTLANAAEPAAPASAVPAAADAAPTTTNQAPDAPAHPPAGADVAAPPPAEPSPEVRPPAGDDSARELRATKADVSTQPATQPRGPTTALEDELAIADDGSMGSHQLHTYAAIGYRVTRVASDGFQPFSRKPALNQFSLLAGRVLGVSEALSFALGAAWEYGGSSADVRGADTSLDLHRITLVPELRYHLLRRLYAFGRLGAGVAIVQAELDDAVIGARRTSQSVLFSVDPSVGLALELIGEPSGASRQPRVWVLLDAGYLVTPAKEVVLANESAAPARTDDYSFGDLGLSGPSARLAAALSF